jgi:hypothetical protein
MTATIKITVTKVTIFMLLIQRVDERTPRQWIDDGALDFFAGTQPSGVISSAHSADGRNRAWN